MAIHTTTAWYQVDDGYAYSAGLCPLKQNIKNPFMKSPLKVNLRDQRAL